MLYDPKWEVKADPRSLTGLIAWLEKQPADQEYCYTSNGHCLLAQYFTAAGYALYSIGANRVSWFSNRELHRELLPPGFNDIAMAKPRTFGAALERARLLTSMRDITSGRQMPLASR